MIHGGDIYTNGFLEGISLVDFSSNINPLGVPESFKIHLDQALETIVRYPDIKYRKVLESLREYTGIAEENFVLGNGAAEVIDLCISCFKSILIVVPSFIEYELDAERHGCKIEYSYLNEDKSYDYEDIMCKIKNSEALIIGNPNNPNGGIVDKEKFETILNFCEKEGKTIIIDEAFIEFVGDIRKSLIDYIGSYRCLFIIRALTKFFAMPGIRFGYGISDNKELLKKIKDKQNPWNINCFAEVAVRYVLKDWDYINRSEQWIKNEREYLWNKLKQFHFISEVYKTNANYFLVKLKEIDCDELYNYCLDNKVLIRKADNYKGLGKNYVRFAIKDRETNLKLIEILSKLELVV